MQNYDNSRMFNIRIAHLARTLLSIANAIAVHIVEIQIIQLLMGQSNSHSLSEDNELLKIYAIEGRSKEMNLTYLIHRQTQQSYLLREHIYNNENQFHEVLGRIEVRLQFRSANLINLIKVEHFQEDNLCSKQYRIYALWDYSKTSLCDEISERALQKRAFSAQQLRSMLSQLAKGMLTLQKNKICHESVTTKTILIQQPFTIKLVDPIAFPLRSNLDIVSLKRTVKNIYLSPQQCSLVNEQRTQPQSDPFRSDVFTAGIIILECGLLQRQDQCYAEDCSIVNWSRLELNLRIIQDQYGYELKFILAKMLKHNPAQRIDWYELDNRLSRGDFGSPSNILRSSSPDRNVRVSLPAPRNPIMISHSVPIKLPVANNGFVIKNVEGARIPMIYRDARGHFQNNAVLTNKALFTSRPVERVYLKEIPKRTTVFTTETLTRNQLSPDSTMRPRISSNHSYVRHVQPKPFNIDNQLSVGSTERKEYSENKKFQNSLDEPIFVMEQLEHGSKYEGYKLKGQREGWGTFRFQDGGKYEGEWRDNLMSGKGKLFYQSGRLAYEGDWLKDKFHGLGTLYNDNPQLLTTCFDYSNFDEIDEYWISYLGEFKDDVKEGQGRLELTNGELLQGTFCNDTIEGLGTYHTLDGKQVRGIWRQNRLQRKLD